jgi:hypothetical protein
MTVVPLYKCVCGKAGSPRIMTCETVEEKVTANFVSCDECMERTEKFLAQLRPVFNAMVTCGVPRDIANETMTFLLGSLPDDDDMLGVVSSKN